MRGAIPSLPNTPSWRGAQFKKKAQGQLNLFTFAQLRGVGEHYIHFNLQFYAVL
jgi:hypothetical protein